MGLRRRAKQDYKGIIANFGYSKNPKACRANVCNRRRQHCTPASVPVNEPRTVAGRSFRGRLAAGPVAQWLEPAAHNGLVAGSSPAGPTNESTFCADTKRVTRFPNKSDSIAALKSDSIS